MAALTRAPLRRPAAAGLHRHVAAGSVPIPPAAGRSTQPRRLREHFRSNLVAAASASSVQVAQLPTAALQEIAAELDAAADPKQRIKTLVAYGAQLEGLPEEAKVMRNRVMGCTAQVWLTAKLAADGTVQLAADSDSDVTRGLCAVLVKGLHGLKPQELAEVSTDALLALPLGPAVMAPSRTNGFLNMLETARKLARGLMGEMETFPSLLLKANSISAQGPFAESQAQYLSPNPEAVDRVAELLSSKKVGVVAHFYMDPQVQGVLSSAAERWPHIHISDSLVMADTAVRQPARPVPWAPTISTTILTSIITTTTTTTTVITIITTTVANTITTLIIITITATVATTIM
eukprot:jgi/Tetstr1/432101/TSEL_021572.t1